MANKVAQIQQYGQKIWFDNISRQLLQSGELIRLIDQDKIAGITSNPTIFHKAISTDDKYKDELNNLRISELNHEQRYETLVIRDIKDTCDIMRVLYDTSDKADGYVSLEVSPKLANDTHGTIENARRLWQIVAKPNLMIKIPATKSGIAAFEQLTSEGINVNITLIFSIKQVTSVWQAYLNGLNKRLTEGKPINSVKAVASFFLSRIDSAIDNILPEHLKGKIAINLAKFAYQKYLDLFNGEEFSQLKSAGASGQYLLWASTGTKNKNYSDVLYVEELIGKDTINTLPEMTLNAFRDHGIAKNSLEYKIDQAQDILKQAKQYINMEELGEKLQQEGLKAFSESFEQLTNLVK